MSISNAQRQRVRSLQQRKFRRKYTAFLVEGRVNVMEVLSSGLEVLELYGFKEVLDNFRENLSFGESLKTAKQVEVGQSELERLSTQRSPDGAIAVVQMPTHVKSTFERAKRLLLLDGISDPGNAGTLIRTAEWFGVEGVLSLPGSVEWYNPKVVAAARGSLFRIPHLSIDYSDLSTHFSSHQLVVADLEGSPFDSFKWADHSILTIGSESHGPREELLQLSPKRITIPRAKGQRTESLNAGVAGAILLSSWR